MKKIFPVVIILSLLSFLTNAQQNVGIGTSTPDSSAKLDITSDHQGLLIPRMTTEKRDSIVAPATSLLIFNTTTNCFEAFVNGAWYHVSCPGACTIPAAVMAGINTASATEITWNWDAVTDATGYKYNTVNNYNTAIPIGTDTGYTQTGLTCNTSYTLFVWAFNTCGSSIVTHLMQTTTACGPSCGSQVWAAANLNTGTMINSTSAGSQQTGNQKYCYNNLASNCDIYGGLYEWSDLMLGAASVNCDPCGPTTGHGGVQGMCPVGYHIPSDLEWSRYEHCLDSTNTRAFYDTTVAQQGSTTTGMRGTTVGAQLKAASPDWNGTNASGFGALPGGYRQYLNGQFYSKDSFGIYWTATQSDASYAFYRILQTGYSQSERVKDDKAHGFSVRCLKD